MSSAQEVVVLARLAGVRQFIAQNEELIAAQKELALATREAGYAMEESSKKSWLFNQALFTLRRFAYMGTLAMVGFGAEALKWGFQYNSAMQTARVALQPFFADSQGLNDALQQLFQISKYSSFTIKDMTLSFRALYPAMHLIGISSGQTIQTLQALINALSVAGKVSGPSLNRVTVALQHMAFQGRLTGLTVNQLARDGIALYPVLNKELGVTEDQMHRIGQLNIPANVAMQAIIRFYTQAPGFAGAAARLARGTVQGQFQIFRDNMSRLMGGIEKDVFQKMQGRLNDLGNWFNRFFAHFGNRAVSLRTVLVYAFGGGAGLFYDQVIADLRLLWQIFVGLVRDITQSKAIWVGLYGVLVLLHGILIFVNFVVKNFGWLINVLVPLLVGWKIATFLLNVQLKWLRFWTEVDTAAQEGMASATAILRARTLIYAAAAWAASVATQALSWAQLIWGDIMQFGLMPTLIGVIGELWAMTAALLANPVFDVIAGFILLGVATYVLYTKWKWFRDFVNGFFDELKNNARALKDSFSPLIWFFENLVSVVTNLLGLIQQLIDKVEFLHKIEKAITPPIPHLGKGRSAGARVADFVTSLIFPGVGAFGAFATGGVVPSAGPYLVGERGPEMMMLPAGASIIPVNDPRPVLKGYTGDIASDRPLVIQLVLDRRVLEEVTVKGMQSRQARR